jgi:hypothetical protein
MGLSRALCVLDGSTHENAARGLPLVESPSGNTRKLAEEFGVAP